MNYDRIVLFGREINCVTIVPYTLTKYQGKSSTLEIINQYFLLNTTENKLDFFSQNTLEYSLLLDISH